MCRGHGLIGVIVVGSGLLLSLASTSARAQDPLENAPMAPQSIPKAGEGDAGPGDATSKTDAKAKVKPKPEFINKTPAEWRKLLTRNQYAVTREKATEPPYSGQFSTGHFRGTFVCVCCDAAHVQSELFSAQTKFESGTGWPSFYQAVSNKAVQTAWDYGGLEPRLEVMCRRCGAHLGHVFDDGPLPTGLRFCLNSAAIKLGAPETDAGAKLSSTKQSSKSKAKVAPRTDAKSVGPPTNKGDESANPASSGPGH
jgi:peptide-methionine (R)-S-oxide reductase